MRSIARIPAAAALVAVILGALAAPVFAADEARVRVLHASPDAPAVDVQLDGQPIAALTNVPFGAISDYLKVPAGEHQVTVYPTGTTSTAVIDAAVTVEAGKSYTIAATNPVASIAPKVIVDEPAMSGGSAMIRVVHLSPDAPAVDVAVDGSSPADAVVKGIAFPDATGYLALDPGTYDLEVRVAGTADVALQLDPIMLDAGKAYSAFAIGSAAAEPLGGNGLRVIVAVDATALPDTSTAGPATTVFGPGAWAALAIAAIAGFALVSRRQAGVRAR